MGSLTEMLKRNIPEVVLHGQLVLRRAPDWKKAGLIFVHVPKNGGTSINTAVYGGFMGHFRVRDIERWRSDLFQELPSLAVTRNPWARAFSAYTFARKGAEMKDGAQISRPERYQTAEFDSFERFVLEWLPSRKLDHEDYVFRPQTHFLTNKAGAIAVSHLGQIEEPESYSPFLESALGHPIKIGRLNSTTDPQRYRAAYSLEMQQTLALCYEMDLEKFGYDF